VQWRREEKKGRVRGVKGSRESTSRFAIPAWQSPGSKIFTFREAPVFLPFPKLLEQHAPPMKLYLIRHGETVDNVAGLYAGVRDSGLTVHGVEQARRLGEYFAKNDVQLTHIFSSPLSRAYKTAEAIQKAQPGITDAASDQLSITKVPDLIEQDFGFYEGKPFYARSDPKKNGRAEHYEKHKYEPGFVDVESKESMGKRADAFLDSCLLPLLESSHLNRPLSVAIVSHGMLLSNLWRRLLLRFSRRSMSVSPEVTAGRSGLVLEHLGAWSNTGYLELAMSKETANEPEVDRPDSTTVAEAAPDNASLPEATTSAPKDDTNPTLEMTNALEAEQPQTHSKKSMAGWSTHIVAIDSKQHLVGLKRQRGGIGRAAHDENQTKLDGFFKRQRTN
jgi:broad specificity phosphatase PhoE